MSKYFLIMLISYLIGSIPVGLFVGKFFKTDLRQHGSKNIGATNAYRTLGAWPAFLVFAGDAAKGVLGVWLGELITGGAAWGAILGGLAAIMGHNWSLYLKFSGGRGVATSLGVIAVIAPKVTVLVFLLWFAIVYATKYVSLASIAAAAMTPIFMWIFGEPMEFILFTLAAAIFVIVRHRPNIERLLKGQESRIKAGAVKKRNLK